MPSSSRTSSSTFERSLAPQSHHADCSRTPLSLCTCYFVWLSLSTYLQMLITTFVFCSLWGTLLCFVFQSKYLCTTRMSPALWTAVRTYNTRRPVTSLFSSPFGIQRFSAELKLFFSLSSPLLLYLESGAQLFSFLWIQKTRARAKLLGAAGLWIHGTSLWTVSGACSCIF